MMALEACWHRRRRLSLSQTVHGVRWRKIGDLKTVDRCDRQWRYVAEWEKDLALAKEVIDRDYSDRFLDPKKHNLRNRTILDPDRSLGSVIKLLTPSHALYTDTFNDWLESIPQRVKDLVLIIKRRYRPDWGLDWEKLFSVDSVNGQPANELRFDGDKLITRLLRVGFDEKGSWRLFALRKDFIPANKILAEDDITASTVARSDCSMKSDRAPSRNPPNSFTIANTVSFSVQMTPSIADSTNRRKRILPVPETSSVTSNASPLRTPRTKSGKP